MSPGKRLNLKNQRSAGLLLFRRSPELQVLLAHPGGPFWEGRERGAWTIPKGGVHAEEGPFDAAVREFGEETGLASHAPYRDLGTIVLGSGKTVFGWAFESDADLSTFVSLTTQAEWPVNSGKWITVPEVDRVEFFSIEQAHRLIHPAQRPFLERLVAIVGSASV